MLWVFVFLFFSSLSPRIKYSDSGDSNYKSNMSDVGKKNAILGKDGYGDFTGNEKEKKKKTMGKSEHQI